MKWLARLLFGLGLAALGWCAFVLVDGLAYQGSQSDLLDESVRESEWVAAVVPAGSQLVVRKGPTPSQEVFGRLEIARLGLSVIVAEGVDRLSLRRAAGHVPGTGIPGRTGTIGISAHRDTYFRRLKDIRTGDVIVLTTVPGTYKYRVLSTKVVPPSNVEVMDPDGGEILTLITCYPFYFVGAAPDRFIVRAERIN